MELQALPSRIGQIRRIVSAQLRYWRLDDLVEQASLGVTELLANVHRHAVPDKTCTVELTLLLDRLTVSVRDRDPRLPDVRRAGPLDTNGRGLALIAAVSESWGARPLGASGKTVWFTLAVPAPDPVPVVPVDPALLGLPAVPERIGDGPVAVDAPGELVTVAVASVAGRPCPTAVDDERRTDAHAPARSALPG